VSTDHRHPDLPEFVHLVVIPRRPSDRWPLRGDYVEVVWAEILGPTAVAIVRRLGRAATDLGVDVRFEALTAALAIPPRKALDALRRLHHHRLIEFYEAAANIAVSGWAPSMPGRVAVTLSGYARHAYGDLESDTPDPPVFQPGRRRGDVLAPCR
jgi:hypothetical protein